MRHDFAGDVAVRHHGVVAIALDPTLVLVQARSRWGQGVAVAGLFRPGPHPDAWTSLGKVVSRRSNRRRARLPRRLLVAIDGNGRASLCPYAPDPQGGHPQGDDLYAGPFEELGGVAVGPLSIVVLLYAGRPCVLEAVWLDVEAATVAALLTGEPLPDEPELLSKAAEEDSDESNSFTQTLLAQAELAQARADALLAQAHAALAEEAEETGRPLQVREPLEAAGLPASTAPTEPEPTEPEPSGPPEPEPTKPPELEPTEVTEPGGEPVDGPEHPEPDDPSEPWEAAGIIGHNPVPAPPGTEPGPTGFSRRRGTP